MKHHKCILIITSLVFSLVFSLPLYATTRGIQVVSQEGQALYLYKDYHAVVIGIGDYDHWPNLPNAVRDAEEVAGKLEELGFKVKLVANPDSRQLKSTLSEIARRLGTEKNRALLLYYAGHGETTTLADGTDLGYIIPKDCPLQNLDPFGFDSKAISMKEIETLALKVRSKHMLVMFDSCFSGSLFALSRAAPTDISEKSAKPVRQFMTAGGANETVPDRSIFKVCLLQGLDGEADYNRDGYVAASELGLYLQTKVINYTRGAQHPQYGKINNPYLDKGDFIFVLRDTGEKVSMPSYVNESAKLAEELQRLKREREGLERERRLLEGRKSVEAERQLLENERQRQAEAERQRQEKERLRLASIPKTVAKESLRKDPELLNEMQISRMIQSYNFFDSESNPLGSFKNDFVDNSNGTITDRATGLMWEGGGSPSVRLFKRSKFYAKKLNEDKFAGYSDWRLPTVEELASLLKKDENNGIHIDPLFDNKQKSCWSADKGPLFGGLTANPPQAWHVNFREGSLGLTVLPIDNNDSPTYRYVRAVRSIR